MKIFGGTIGPCRRCRGFVQTGAYRLGRIHRLHPQLRAGKEIVRRATVAVPKKNAAAGEIECILRDISKIAPV